MSEKEKWREKARRGLEAYFKKRSFPRLILGLILTATGLVGLGLSYGLLKAGLSEMWLRYPLAVLGSYVAFLALIRLWVEVERRHFDPEDPAIKDVPEQARSAPVFKKSSGDGWDWLNPLDAVDGFGDADGCLIGILVAILVGLVVVIFTAVVGAPALAAEVFIDAFLAAALYRRLKIAAHEHWLATAIQRTWIFVVATAALLALAGVCLSLLAPGANSIGPALKQIFD